MKSIKLIVGLGNPGAKYSNTRHNIGFKVIDSLGKDCNIKINKKKALSQIGKGKIDSFDVILAKPLTYVNNSGDAVKELLDDFSLTSQDLIIVHDDIDLEKGVLRIKCRGGDGGHNGLRSIISKLQTNTFLRIRLGIGRPESKNDITNYVLSRFDKEEKESFQALTSKATLAIKTLLIKGVTNAMNQFNKRS